MEEGEAMYERDRPTQKVFDHTCFTLDSPQPKRALKVFLKGLPEFTSFQIVLPTAPSATFGPDIDDDK